MKSQILMLLAFIISLSACKKDNAPVKADSQEKTMLLRSASDATTPENTANAYDSIGYWHNQIVAYVENCKPVTETPDVEASTQCVLRFCREMQWPEPSVSFFSTVEQTVNQSNESIENLIANCPYEKPLKAALDSLAHLIKGLSDSDSPYPVIKAAIVDFERTVMQDKQLTPEGRAIALKAASVARYSIYYWINTLQPPVPSAAFKFKNIVKWIAAVTSDIGGAIVSGSVEYAADCSTYAYDLVTYSMP
ncbi:hypothetical protein SAMN05444410_103140 [Hydrobacter penzbergensis]|uniref:Lipoprotein n=1 Tax=Hydrobacter penzbergensis TaxID=1235997 RepID=A0A8X8IDZ5_9BACT|nr:hypothetical protein [Hydrobacter penzbergensis]SDW50355.1 hypothetical protein SAMN05444410_103140 [Hydrobacter penzbergensis]